VNEDWNIRWPEALSDIQRATEAAGFRMASDQLTGSLLRVLAASKPAGALLELGTGTGMGAAWLLSGMDAASTLDTVDHDEAVVSVARRSLAHDSRIRFHVSDGAAFLASLAGQQFDLIFADTWPGKFDHLDEALSLLRPGGIYVVDDLLPQPSWPEGHAPKIPRFLHALEERLDLHLTRISWSTGLVLASKHNNPK
jgi:predicted O-methyltransferase YrrM